MENSIVNVSLIQLSPLGLFRANEINLTGSESQLAEGRPVGFTQAPELNLAGWHRGTWTPDLQISSPAPWPLWLLLHFLRELPIFYHKLKMVHKPYWLIVRCLCDKANLGLIITRGPYWKHSSCKHTLGANRKLLSPYAQAERETTAFELC